MTKDEESALIERVLAGDANAFEPLVLEHQTNVYRLALRLMGNEADAADAAQDAFRALGDGFHEDGLGEALIRRGGEGAARLRLGDGIDDLQPVGLGIGRLYHQCAV